MDIKKRSPSELIPAGNNYVLVLGNEYEKYDDNRHELNYVLDAQALVAAMRRAAFVARGSVAMFADMKAWAELAIDHIDQKHYGKFWLPAVGVRGVVEILGAFASAPELGLKDLETLSSEEPAGRKVTDPRDVMQWGELIILAEHVRAQFPKLKDQCLRLTEGDTDFDDAKRFDSAYEEEFKDRPPEENT